MLYPVCSKSGTDMYWRGAHTTTLQVNAHHWIAKIYLVTSPLCCWSTWTLGFDAVNFEVQICLSADDGMRCFSHLPCMGVSICRYPGYLKLKYQLKGGLPVAFVEFQVGLLCCYIVLLICQNGQQCLVFEGYCTRLSRLYRTCHAEAWYISNLCNSVIFVTRVNKYVFVVVQDIVYSTKALSQLQNSKPLPSVDRGGMRVEYPQNCVCLYTWSSLCLADVPW